MTKKELEAEVNRLKRLCETYEIIHRQDREAVDRVYDQFKEVYESLADVMDKIRGPKYEPINRWGGYRE